MGDEEAIFKERFSQVLCDSFGRDLVWIAENYFTPLLVVSRVAIKILEFDIWHRRSSADF
jgi:hypothetical protein